MRAVLPFALLFACATAVQAQQPLRDTPADLPVVTAEQAAPAPVAAPAATAATDKSVTPSASEIAETAAEASSADAALQSPPRNFWWLVGGIILAGIILAAVL